MPWTDLGTDGGDIDYPAASINFDGSMVVMVGRTYWSPGAPNFGDPGHAEGGDITVFTEVPGQPNWDLSELTASYQPAGAPPPVPVAMGRNQDGHLEVVQTDSNSAVYHNWQQPSQFYAWRPHWGRLRNSQDNKITLPIRIANYSDGRLFLFCFFLTQADNVAGAPPDAPQAADLFTITQQGPNDSEHHWDSWVNVGHPASGGVVGFDVGLDGYARLGVFAVGRDGELWYLQEIPDNPLNNDRWNAWESLGNHSGSLMGTPAVVVDNYLRTVFANDFEGNVYGISEAKNETLNYLYWGDWTKFPSPGSDAVVFGAGVSITGSINVFAQAAGDLWTLPLDGGALAWVSLGAGLVRENHFRHPIVAKNNAGELQIFCIGNKAGAQPELWHLGEGPAGNWL